MKIIILGAGQVGGTLAENLANEQNDITVVDTDSQRLRELQDSIDIKTVIGKGSYPQVLRQAGADDADMLIAVTNSDETNMVACQIAFALFRTPKKISRIRSSAYLKQKDLFKSDAFTIDYLISPEQVVTNYIKRLLEYPGTLQVLDFADEKVQLVAVRAHHGGPLIGQQLRMIRQHMPTADTKVAAIYRRGKSILPTGDTGIEVDDEVFFIAAKNNIKKVMSELRREEGSYKRILIVGGGNIGYRLAKALENKYRLKLIERDEKRAKFLSENLSKTVVLVGSASDKALLEEENIENIDVFCALTNDDESNIISSMLAKRLGARKVMTLINKAAYVDLVQGGVIDIAISPQQTTIGSLLTHVRRGDVVNVHSLRRGAAEAIEAIAHGDKQSSKVVGRAIHDINLPSGTTIGAIVRGNEVIIAHNNVVVESDDHIILFVVDKSKIAEVERLFSVGLGFF